MTSPEVLSLRDGFEIETAVIEWLLDATDRGLRLELTAEGGLRLGPKALATPDDLVFARRYCDDLRRAIDYIDHMATLLLDTIGVPWAVPDVPVSSQPTAAHAHALEPHEARPW